MKIYYIKVKPMALNKLLCELMEDKLARERRCMCYRNLPHFQICMQES
jgi:hypothetical protein